MLARRFRVAATPGNLNNLYGFPLTLLGIPERDRVDGGRDGHVDARRAGRRQPAGPSRRGGLHQRAAGPPRELRLDRGHRRRQGRAPRGPRRGRPGGRQRATIRGWSRSPSATPGRWPGSRLDRTPTTGAIAPRAAPDGGSTSFCFCGPATGRWRCGWRCTASTTSRTSWPPPPAPTGWASSSTRSPRPRPPSRPAAMRGVRAPAGRRRAARRRLLQLQSRRRSARALDSARRLGGERHWAVLGDMLELGARRRELHRRAGREAARLGFAPILGVGELARELVRGRRRARAPRRCGSPTCAAAAAAAAERLRAGDVVLVKGSRGVGLDRLVARARRPRRGRADALSTCSIRCASAFAVFNVFRYITFRTAMAVRDRPLAVACCWALVHPPAQRRSIGQSIRDEGPERHQAKAGTPTMGGLLILFAVLVPTLLWADLTNPLRLAGGRRHARLRRHRLRRRLPEAQAAARTGA